MVVLLFVTCLLICCFTDLVFFDLVWVLMDSTTFVYRLGVLFLILDFVYWLCLVCFGLLCYLALNNSNGFYRFRF